jgi:hypothetical protein
MDEQVQATPTPEISGVPLEQLTSVYIKMRDKRTDLKRKFEAEDADLEAQMRTIEQEMLEVCKSLGADSIKTNAGTIIRSVKSRYWTNDWDSMYRFIKEHDAFALLEKRLHQTHMKQFLEENPDTEPAGLNVEREFTVVVRRSKES